MLLLGFALTLGCSSESEVPEGGEEEACRAGGGCDEGLVCEADLCQPEKPVDDPLEGCTPSCGKAVCGPDGCGGNCGACGGLESCVAGECLCAPQCTGLQCGDDGCGGICGSCADDLECMAGVCVCHPQCDGLECGDNGCGGSCGECEWPAACEEGWCYAPDGCGECPEGTVCGYFEDPADWCGGDGCEPGLEYDGECGGEDGNTLIWCEEGTTIAIDCDFFDSESICDWADEVEYYDCL